MPKKPLLEFTDKGIYCSKGKFYIDPWKPVDDAVIAAFRDQAANIIAACVTEPAENTFPALPARVGESVLVTFAFSIVPPP